MEWLADDSPIVACSTGRSEQSAIAVIRLSGFTKLDDLASFFSINLKELEPRKALLSYLLCPKSEEKLDQVLLTFFPAPHSFTGENVLEIHCHGNQLLVDLILNNFTTDELFRYAHAGEFSYRAFRNKKLSLTQVEGLDVLLNSSTSLGVRNGLKILNGQLDQRYEKLLSSSLDLLSALELGIDFLEDVGDEAFADNLKLKHQVFIDNLSELHHKMNFSDKDLLHPKICLFGPANAGKSTFFNYLLKEKRAIVSEIAGTTRDYISESLYSHGSYFKLVDTAGLRVTDDFIESEGINSAHQLLRDSFFKVLVFDPLIEDRARFAELLAQSPDLVIFTHADCPHFDERLSCLVDLVTSDTICLYSTLTGPIGPAFNFVLDGPIGPEFLKKIAPIEPVILSGPIGPEIKKFFGPIGAKSEDGPIGAELRELVLALCSYKYDQVFGQKEYILDRHKGLISKIYQNVNEIDFSDSDVVFIAHQFRSVQRLIEELVGVFSPNDVLNNIFTNFCIGK